MKLVYEINKNNNSVIINNKYLIDTKTGVLFYNSDYVGTKKDFPLYVFQIRNLLIDTGYIK